jgi:hypothetical protein
MHLSAILLLVLVMMAPVSRAQKATARLDSSEIQIGRQIYLHLELTQPRDKKFTWPTLPDSIHKIEVLARSPHDTVVHTSSQDVTIRQSLLITCFDSGYYAIPSFRFYDTSNPDSLTNYVETAPLLLAVHTVAVDTTAAIKDIKTVIHMPLTWQDYLRYVALVLAVALIIVLAWWLYRKYRKKPVAVVRKVPTLPPHEIALKALHELKEKKLWQQGQIKTFYTELTDILRIYLEHRWQVPAMEMTTDEILQYPVIYKLEDSIRKKLQYILTIADLVKFARMITVPQENEQSMQYAFDFVYATAPRTLMDEEVKRKEEATV